MDARDTSNVKSRDTILVGCIYHGMPHRFSQLNGLAVENKALQIGRTTRSTLDFGLRSTSFDCRTNEEAEKAENGEHSQEYYCDDGNLRTDLQADIVPHPHG